MCTETSEQDNAVLDRILAERRSHRRFRRGFPDDDEIRRILHAGLLAPFAAAAVGSADDYFRRFFVIRNGSEAMKAAAPLVYNAALKMAADLDSGMAHDAQLRARASGFASRLAVIRKMGMVPGVGTAPFYIVAAEKRGFPPVEQLSLSHCMENMWLKATALGLGFQLVSITSQMADDPAFCSILGIAPGGWGLAGCAVGFPCEKLSPALRPPVEQVTRWPE